MTKTLILAALAATSLIQPAFAKTASQTVVVEHRDLDLGTAAGARTLQHRIWRAVVAVCGATSDIDIAGKNDIRQCRRDTMQIAARQAERAIASAAHGEPVRVAAIRN